MFYLEMTDNLHKERRLKENLTFRFSVHLVMLLTAAFESNKDKISSKSALLFCQILLKER